MSTFYKICKRTIEAKKFNGEMDEQFKNGMVQKLDIYMAADKISADEYTELVAMMEAKDEEDI